MEQEINIDGQKLVLKHLEFDTPVDWHQAQKKCADLGEGWRLPTISELKMIYKELYQQGNFHSAIYWSGTATSSFRAWVFDFAYGTDDYGYFKDKKAYIVAIKSKNI